MTARIVPTTTDTLRRLSRARHACKGLMASFETLTPTYGRHTMDVVSRVRPTGENKGRGWEASP